MKISKNWLEKYFENKLPKVEELSDLFTFHVCEVESIEKVGDDEVLDLKILPDRAHYMLCHKGVAGEVSTLLKLPLKKSALPVIQTTDTKRKISVSVVDKDFCPRYTARVMENVAVTDSPKWLREKLSAIGARSINTVVDATNYVMFDVGQPLHAFDADKVTGNITVRPAVEGEKITTLDGKEIKLTSADSVIADDAGPLAIAGVKGGNKAEVTHDTKNIILESANFNAVSVRKTSVRVGIKNDAVKRYENAITPELTAVAMDAVTALISQLSSEVSSSPVVGAVIDIYPNPVKPWSITVSADFINKKLGTGIPEEEMAEILKGLGITVRAESGAFNLTIPTERLDLVIPEDISEEVGRIYGYDKIAGKELTKTTLKPAVNKEFYYSEKIKNILSGLGFNEVYLYSLTSKGDFEVTYPLASDKAFLRKDLSESMLKCVEKNSLNLPLLGLDSVRVFEIGKIFSANSEELHLAISIKAKKAEVMVKEALKECGLDENQKITNQNGTAICEINLSAIFADVSEAGSYSDLDFALGKKVNYKKFSPYPFIVRDIAFFVPENEAGITEVETWKVIEDSLKSSNAMPLITRHSLFDVFKKDGKTSYAFRLVFQSQDRTLSDEEVNPIMKNVYENISKKGWQIR